MTDISETLAPKSEQLDNIELADGPRDFTVERVVVKHGAEQPVSVYFAEFPRPWRPGVTMRRVLGGCWTNDSSTWPGKRVRLFRDPDVTYGRDKPGGTRISHLSHIPGPMDVPVLLSQGRMGTYHVDPLPSAAPAKDWDAVLATAAGITDLDALQELWRREGVGSAPQQIQDAVNARATQLKENPSE
jgi:hypothetical protein